ncbi:MAG: NAD(P)/FAD-dependent oxidoreductase [Candidatus Zixiibacteriota bacterium]
MIGAGPVGLYALYYAGLRNVKVKLLEALDEAGGGLKVLYPEKYIYDVAGFPQVLAKDLVNEFEKQARAYENPILFNQRVQDIKRRDDDIIELVTETDTHYTKTAIICAGMGAFIPRKLDIPDLEKYEELGVFYYIKDSSLFKDKNVLIVGGGDSAVDNALMLEPIAKHVIMIHRNDRFRAHENSLEQLKNSSVELHYPFWEVKEIHGEDWVNAVTAVNTFEGKEMRFEIDMLILNLGFLTNLKPLRKWGLELEMNAIKVDERMRTNIPGVFAAGDIVTHPGKLKLISTGTGEAAIAVNNAVHFIDPSSQVEPGHSSHIGKSPKE